MSNLVCSIGRQFGSGGREIGLEVAKRLGIACYDNRLLRPCEMDGEVNEAANETTGYSKNLSAAMFSVQSEMIRSLVKREPCVIIGRCADVVLREEERLVPIFIFADMDKRIARIMERRALSEREAIALIKKSDKQRKQYYEHFSGKKWGALDNYAMLLDRGRLGEAACVDLICTLAKQR